MTVQIRPAEADDIAGIFHVRLSVTENVLSMAELAELGITAESVAGMIAAEECAWVAVEHGRVIGFSMIDQQEACLFAAFVLPAHEGRGIGRRLVQRAESQLLARHDRCWLETGAKTRAAGFYRRLGWSNERSASGGDIRLEKRRS